MGIENNKTITVENTIQAPIDKVWRYWTDPTHIKKWNNASDDWHTPFAENDLKKRRKISLENGIKRW